MAATALRSGDSIPSQQPENNDVGRTSSSRRKHDHANETGHSSRDHTAAAGQGHRGSSRSFSARAKNLPADWKDKPFPSEPSDSLEDYDYGYVTPKRRPLSSNPPAPQEQSPRDESTPSTIPSSQQSTPISRSGTVRSKEQRRDWASDRSPLQKLEVTLNGITKEEKRAKVMEAELRLKERIERQSNKDHRESSSPAQKPTSTTREHTRPKVAAPQKTRPVRDAQEANRSKEQQHSPANVQVEKSRFGHKREPSFRHVPVPQSGELNYVKPSTAQAVTISTVPRRAVSVSHHPENQGTRSANRTSLQENMIPKRAVSQLDPVSVPPRKAVPRQVDTRGLGQPQPQPLSDRSVQQRASYTPGTNPWQPTAETYPKQDGVASGALQPGEGKDAQNASRESTMQSKPKRQTVSFNVPPPTPPPLSEWKNAPVARLCLSDFEDLDMTRGKAWWEGGNSNRRRSRGLPNTYQAPTQKPKSYKTFQPALFLKSGPLLRYTGMKRVQIDGPNGPFEKVTWRGSIMIVTKNSGSVYEPAPSLRIFSQQMDLLPPPPVVVNDDVPPEYVDPTAGLMKLGRDGRPLYVKPVDHTEEEQDLSQIEDDDGIYELSASMLDYSSDGVKQPIPANRVHSTDGEMAGTYKDLTGIRLYADPDRDVTFWRFNLEVELGQTQQRIAYRINQGPALGFWVPAQGQMMNIAFHSGNGFKPGVDTDKFCGPDPLWRDILNEHQTRPFHVMIGGGDQIFNGKVTAESTHFQEWLKIKSLEDQYDSPFDPEFRAELESSFLEHYSTWSSQGLFSLVGSQIPMVNMWNDHEIIEGFGSYPDDFMQTPVISGLGRIAFKYYLLFQHHSVPEETDADEPSWLLGAGPGPYIKERSRNLFMSLGKGVTLLGLDSRTERMTQEILSEPTCDLIWDRCHREITRGEIKHLIVLSSIPIAYPRMAMLKNILNSRKSLGKAGLFGGLVNKNGGKIEIYDDHWTAKHHKAERSYLLEDLQDLAAEKSIRVTVLSGDVHLAAMGQFYSNPKLGVAKDKDYRYMPNIISSGIANCPETEMVSDMLNRRNQVHHMDSNTDEDMIPIFTQDVDGKPRNNKRLLPRRNWCSIREYQPGSTPPGTPDQEEYDDDDDEDDQEEEPRPGMLKRTLSLTRGDKPAGGLLRRLSGRGPPPTRDFNLSGKDNNARRMSMDGPFPPAATGDIYFPRPSQESSTPTRPGFFRRPTNLSRSASKKSTKSNNNNNSHNHTTGDDGVGGMVNLEGGLAITLNLELNCKDPSGITTPYKLLVPMLRFDGVEYDPPATQVTKGWKKWLSVRRKKENPTTTTSPDKQNTGEETEGGYNDDESDESDEADYPEHHNWDEHRNGQEEEDDSGDSDQEPPEDKKMEKTSKKKKWFGLG